MNQPYSTLDLPSANEELSCKEFVELVTDYLEGVMPPPERTRFEEHITECEGCDIYLTQMEQTIQVMGALVEESIAEPAKNKLLQAFRDWKQGGDPTKV